MALRKTLLVEVGLCLMLGGCGLGQSLSQKLTGGGPSPASLGETEAPAAVFGYAVADEPQAALAARQILNEGGNAADAAAAAGFAMAVTLPSRAGLGGGGACIIRMPDAAGAAQPPVALLFPPGAPASGGGSRPAAVPSLARGLLALQARYGSLPVASIIVPAEQLSGTAQVSPALGSDLQVVGNALLADPATASIFRGPGGGVRRTGDNIYQPDLAVTLEKLRTEDVQSLYAGGFADEFIRAANAAGADLTLADLSQAIPQFVQPDMAKLGKVSVASIPNQPPHGNLPATAAFAALDKNGGVVACATTMNNLFGTGRVAQGTGILLAASPYAVPTPVLAAGVGYQGDKFRAVVTGTGQAGALQAEMAGMQAALRKLPAAAPPVPEPGRANIIACPGGMPGDEASCTAIADPRGNGLATGGR